MRTLVVLFPLFLIAGPWPEQDKKGNPPPAMEITLSAIRAMDPYQKFQEIKGTVHARVEDLKLTPVETDLLGTSAAKAEIGVKNLTDKQLHLTVYLSLFDGSHNLIACGNYCSMPYFGGFEPRETDTETINLGYCFTEPKAARYYQYKVTSWLSEPAKK